MSLLKVENMHVYYGNIHAIKGVSFEVNEGEIVTLIGANGAGKSTTLNTIAGLLKPRSGQVTFDGKSVVGMPASKVVSLGMALCPEGRRIFQQMGRPKLLMLDEPSMGLAPKLVDQIFDIIAELHAAGTTILLVEQNALMALHVASRGYVLETGRITLADDANKLLNDNSVKAAYLGG